MLSLTIVLFSGILHHTVTYHDLVQLAFCEGQNVLIHVGGVSYEATFGTQGHVLGHGLCGRGQQEPVHAVEATHSHTGGQTDRQTDRCNSETASPAQGPPVQVLFILHLIFSSPLSDEVVVPESQYFAPEHDSVELVVLPQDHQRRLQCGSLLHVQSLPTSGHQFQRIKQRVALHRSCDKLVNLNTSLAFRFSVR